jgi:hypothetical protein
MNHQLNRLTGRTGITQPTHSLVQYIRAESKMFKQTFDMNLIPARRAFDINSIPSKRAFRGMAGLVGLYPSVVDYIGQAIKDSPVCLLGDLRGYSVNLCR